MKRQKSCGPHLGKWVHQLPGVVTFAYDICFRCVIACLKGIVEDIHFGGSIMPSNIIENLYIEKPSFGPSKWPQKLKPAKNSKLPKLPENRFEPFGKGGWPPISTWINIWSDHYKQLNHGGIISVIRPNATSCVTPVWEGDPRKTIWQLDLTLPSSGC